MFDSATNGPPGPTGIDVARWMYRINENTFRAFYDLTREYGDVVRMPFTPERSIYLFSRPEHAKHVLQDNHRNYRKAATYDYLRPVLGNGLLVSHGDLWLRQRRLVAPMFHRDRVTSFTRRMVDRTKEMLDEWEHKAARGESIDVAEQMGELTLTIAGEVLFNRDIRGESERIGEALLLLFRDVNYRIVSPFAIPRSVPTPHNRRVQQAMDDLEEIVFEMIDERRGNERDHEDLLSMLMLAEDEETGETMSDRQIRDELMTFLIAGHDTTSNALSWALYLLSLHPRVRRRLEDEVDETLESRRPSVASIAELDYIEQILDETLRLYPPAWTIEREPRSDDDIGGWDVPEGSIVVVAPYFVHHNPDVWANPEGFDPARFETGSDRARRNYEHFPFGGGPRMCVGADFAVREATTILAMIADRFRLNLLPGQRVEPEGTVTLYPRDGIDMELEPREEEA